MPIPFVPLCRLKYIHFCACSFFIYDTPPPSDLTFGVPFLQQLKLHFHLPQLFLLPPPTFCKFSNLSLSRLHSTHTLNMSHEEDLIDYSDEEVGGNETAAPSAKKTELAASNDVDKKGSYVGIYSTGFRDFLLKPELIRAIADCGFEHPSDG